MYVASVTVSDYMTNCYLAGCEETKEAMIVDPGGNFESIQKMIEHSGYKIKYIVCTHGHHDHILATKQIKDYTQAKVYIHEKERKCLQNSLFNGAVVFGVKHESCKEDGTLSDGDELEVGNLRFSVIHTPGHTKGGICLYTPGHLFSGDTLFYGTIGRTDFPGGNYKEIVHSIQEKLYQLPEETIVYPGHGNKTTIGHEKMYNAVVRLER